MEFCAACETVTSTVHTADLPSISSGARQQAKIKRFMTGLSTNTTHIQQASRRTAREEPMRDGRDRGHTRCCDMIWSAPLLQIFPLPDNFCRVLALCSLDGIAPQPDCHPNPLRARARDPCALKSPKADRPYKLTGTYIVKTTYTVPTHVDCIQNIAKSDSF